jgi:hypothetical protein
LAISEWQAVEIVTKKRGIIGDTATEVIEISTRELDLYAVSRSSRCSTCGQDPKTLRSQQPGNELKLTNPKGYSQAKYLICFWV